MNGFKRKIKKRNLDDLVLRKRPRRLRLDEKKQYTYAMVGTIPAGKYFSTITGIEYKPTWYGYSGVEVYYELIDEEFCYNVANGMLSDDEERKPYYVKQFYPEKTQHFSSFVNAMTEALGYDKFIIEESVGVTEWVTFSYNKHGYGSLSGRVPYEWDELMGRMTDEEDE